MIMDYRVKISIMPKPALVDAPSVQIRKLLQREFHIETANLSLGKYIEYTTTASTKDEATIQAEGLGKKLANFNMETPRVISVEPIEERVAT